MAKRLSNFWRKKSRQACLNCNLDVRGKISREKRLFWKKIYMFLFIVFGLPAKIFQNFGETIPAKLSQLHFTCLWEECEQNYKFEENNFNFYFQNFNRKIRPFVKKTADSSKLHSRCPEERFEEKHFFGKTNFDKSYSNIDRKEKNFSVKKLQRDCQNWILRVDGNVLGENIFSNKKFFFNLFRTLSLKIP